MAFRATACDARRGNSRAVSVSGVSSPTRHLDARNLDRVQAGDVIDCERGCLAGVRLEPSCAADGCEGVRQKCAAAGNLRMAHRQPQEISIGLH